MQETNFYNSLYKSFLLRRVSLFLSLYGPSVSFAHYWSVWQWSHSATVTYNVSAGWWPCRLPIRFARPNVSTQLNLENGRVVSQLYSTTSYYVVVLGTVEQECFGFCIGENHSDTTDDSIHLSRSVCNPDTSDSSSLPTQWMCRQNDWLGTRTDYAPPPRRS